MKTFEITAHINGTTRNETIKANDRAEALEIAWSKGYDDVYVTEVADDGAKNQHGGMV